MGSNDLDQCLLEIALAGLEVLLAPPSALTGSHALLNTHHCYPTDRFLRLAEPLEDVHSGLLSRELSLQKTQNRGLLALRPPLHTSSRGSRVVDVDVISLPILGVVVDVVDNVRCCGPDPRHLHCTCPFPFPTLAIARRCMSRRTALTPPTAAFAYQKGLAKSQSGAKGHRLLPR